ncbi:MAG: mug [Thermoleophilia bacterium]|nr:mug [Thermoleophilia bacterium]
MRPTREQLEAARGGHVPDLVRPGLDVLMSGINPSLWSVVVGHHFARPGNRFWPALHDSGFTDRLLRPEEEHELLAAGVGITNVCMRGTARADELDRAELRAGRLQLEAKVAHWQPRCLAILGVTAYRDAFERPGATFGLQRETVAGTPVWVLPNPSGLNAHFQRADLARVFAELREFVVRERAAPRP